MSSLNFPTQNDQVNSISNQKFVINLRLVCYLFVLFRFVSSLSIFVYSTLLCQFMQSFCQGFLVYVCFFDIFLSFPLYIMWVLFLCLFGLAFFFVIPIACAIYVTFFNFLACAFFAFVGYFFGNQDQCFSQVFDEFSLRLFILPYLKLEMTN